MNERNDSEILDLDHPQRFVSSITPMGTHWRGFYVSPSVPTRNGAFWIVPGTTGMSGDLTITKLYIVTTHLLSGTDRTALLSEINAYLEEELKFAVFQAPVNFVKLRTGIEVVEGYANPDIPGGLELTLRRIQ